MSDPTEPPAWALDAVMRIHGEMPSHIDAARIVAAAAPKDEWLPIESAPKDGTRVLVDWSDAHYPYICYFGGGEWKTDSGGRFGIQPAKWRPLPTAPAMKGAE